MNRYSIKSCSYLKISQYSQENACVGSLFFDKNAGLQSSNFIKKRLQYRIFSVNIAKFLRTPVLKNICERLFQSFPTWTNNIFL